MLNQRAGDLRALAPIVSYVAASSISARTGIASGSGTFIVPLYSPVPVVVVKFRGRPRRHGYPRRRRIARRGRDSSTIASTTQLTVGEAPRSQRCLCAYVALSDETELAIEC
jgi:hypothetical protein